MHRVGFAIKNTENGMSGVMTLRVMALASLEPNEEFYANLSSTIVSILIFEQLILFSDLNR